MVLFYSFLLPPNIFIYFFIISLHIKQIYSCQITILNSFFILFSLFPVIFLCLSSLNLLLYFNQKYVIVLLFQLYIFSINTTFYLITRRNTVCTREIIKWTIYVFYLFFLLYWDILWNYSKVILPLLSIK